MRYDRASNSTEMSAAELRKAVSGTVRLRTAKTGIPLDVDEVCALVWRGLGSGQFHNVVDAVMEIVPQLERDHG